MTEDSGQGLTTKPVVCLLERTVRFEEVGGKDQKSLFTSWLIRESWLTTVNFTMSYLKNGALGAIMKINEMQQIN